MKTQIFPDIDDITFSEKSDKTGNWSYLWGSKLAFDGVVCCVYGVGYSTLKLKKKKNLQFFRLESHKWFFTCCMLSRDVSISFLSYGTRDTISKVK